MSAEGAAADSGMFPVLCARCFRAPRDSDDRATWVALADKEVCPGCVTQSDRERLRLDEQP